MNVARGDRKRERERVQGEGRIQACVMGSLGLLSVEGEMQKGETARREANRNEEAACRQGIKP